MEKFLKRQPPKLTQEEIGNMNSLICILKIKLVIKHFPTKKIKNKQKKHIHQAQMTSLVNSYKYLRKKGNQFYTKFSRK